MFKRWIMLAGFLGLVLVVCIQSSSLHLLFFVLFPSLMFPLIYLFDDRRRGWPFYIALAGVIFVFGLYVILIKIPALFFLAICLAVFFGIFGYYRRGWQHMLNEKKLNGEIALKEYELLKEKHQSRLESLHHLENQVTGLLDLFERARDFSESLSMEGLATLLHQKVLPELPFEEMKIVELDSGSESEPATVYVINAKGVEKLRRPPTTLEINLIAQLDQQSAQVRDAADGWAFPLSVERSKVVSCILVRGANEDDLAKFEVLGSYLALQVKKVKLYETVRELSIRDELTGVFVRRHFLERFEEELKRSVKHKLSLAVLMLDIDHFKRYNDDYGHMAGDGVLRQVTDLLKENLRKVDIVARYGGEEFVIVLPESHKEGALDVAERIRSSIARNNFKIFKERTRVTVSIGGVVFPSDGKSNVPMLEDDFKDLAFDLVQRADKALYRAKEEGRNRVIFYQDF